MPTFFSQLAISLQGFGSLYPVNAEPAPDVPINMPRYIGQSINPMRLSKLHPLLLIVVRFTNSRHKGSALEAKIPYNNALFLRTGDTDANEIDHVVKAPSHKMTVTKPTRKAKKESR